MAAYTTIDDPEAYFQTQNYTANGTAIGSGGLTVTFDGTTAMQPDLVTLKMLGDSNLGHYYDSVRGVTKLWYEQVNSTGGTDTEGVTSFNSDGFTIGNTGNINTNDTTLNRHLNRTKCWKAGTTSGIQQMVIQQLLQALIHLIKLLVFQLYNIQAIKHKQQSLHMD